MGYRSCYNLNTDREDINEEVNIISELIDCCEDARYAIDVEGDCQEECKWYDSDEDMKAFSLKYPDVLFTMKRRGEESEDMCTTYYKNGKMQEEFANITYDDFDEAKLK